MPQLGLYWWHLNDAGLNQMLAYQTAPLFACVSQDISQPLWCAVHDPICINHLVLWWQCHRLTSAWLLRLTLVTGCSPGENGLWMSWHDTSSLIPAGSMKTRFNFSLIYAGGLLAQGAPLKWLLAHPGYFLWSLINSSWGRIPHLMSAGPGGNPSA